MNPLSENEPSSPAHGRALAEDIGASYAHNSGETEQANQGGAITLPGAHMSTLQIETPRRPISSGERMLPVIPYRYGVILSTFALALHFLYSFIVTGLAGESAFYFSVGVGVPAGVALSLAAAWTLYGHRGLGLWSSGVIAIFAALWTVLSLPGAASLRVYACGAIAWFIVYAISTIPWGTLAQRFYTLALLVAALDALNILVGPARYLIDTYGHILMLATSGEAKAIAGTGVGIGEVVLGIGDWTYIAIFFLAGAILLSRSSLFVLVMGMTGSLFITVAWLVQAGQAVPALPALSLAFVCCTFTLRAAARARRAHSAPQGT